MSLSWTGRTATIIKRSFPFRTLLSVKDVRYRATQWSFHHTQSCHSAFNPFSPFSSIGTRIGLGLTIAVSSLLAIHYSSLFQVDCSPTYQGVPVAATFLIHQATPIIADAFPGLEISAVFAPGLGGHVYQETGGVMGMYRTGAVLEVPMFERLSAEEEQRLGAAGIFKEAVGVLRVTGDCKYGCAKVQLRTLTLFSLDAEGQLDRDHPIWSFKALG